MDRKKILLLLGALVIAIGTAMMARSMFAGAAAPSAQAVAVEPEGPKVLVAQRALPVGTIITADSVSYQNWPKEMVQDAYFIDGEADMSKLLGTVVRNPITAGQPITQGSLVAPGDRGFLAAALGPGMRAVTITVSQKTGVAGFIFPGDHVDLLLTSSVKAQDGDDDQALKTTETILRNLRVLATDQATNTEVVDGKSIVRTSKTVTIEVTRHSHFYVWQMIVPLLIVPGMAFAVFFLPPPDLSDRMTVIIASLLTVVALSYSLHSGLPKIPYLTVIDWLFVLAYAFLGLAMAGMVWISTVHHRDEARALRYDRLLRWMYPAAYVLSAGVMVSAAVFF